MYERFTDRARKVMQLANQEAQRFNHEYIGTEHILLGLIKEGSGVAANVLKNLDVDLRKIRLEVEKLVQSRPGHGHHGQAAADAAGQEGHRVLDRGGPQPQPQLRGHRAPPAGPAARAGGRGRPGADEPGPEARRSPRGGAQPARPRDGRPRGGRAGRRHGGRRRRRTAAARQVEDPGPGQLRPRPDRAGPAGQARPGHRPREGNRARRCRSSAAAPRTTPSCWARPASARRPSSRASPR